VKSGGYKSHEAYPSPGPLSGPTVDTAWILLYRPIYCVERRSRKPPSVLTGRTSTLEVEAGFEWQTLPSKCRTSI